MAKQKYYVRIPGPDDEDYFIIKKYEFEDLSEAIQSIAPNRKFWDGAQWSILGGSISALIATAGYHLFESSPEQKGLLVGYMFSVFCLILFVTIAARSKENDFGIEHYKQNAQRIMKRLKELNNRQLQKMKDEENKKESIEALTSNISSKSDFESPSLSKFSNIFKDIK